MAKKSHQQVLTLSTLGELAGGQAEATVNAALRAALRDTEDRGADKKPRKVVIEVELKKLSADAVSATVRAFVKCALEPNASTGTFQVAPLPGELEAALDAGFAVIGTRLAEALPEGVPVYYGQF